MHPFGPGHQNNQSEHFLHQQNGAHQINQINQTNQAELLPSQAVESPPPKEVCYLSLSLSPVLPYIFLQFLQSPTEGGWQEEYQSLCKIPNTDHDLILFKKCMLFLSFFFHFISFFLSSWWISSSSCSNASRQVVD
jgi:hypothetical protein